MSLMPGHVMKVPYFIALAQVVRVGLTQHPCKYCINSHLDCVFLMIAFILCCIWIGLMDFLTCGLPVHNLLILCCEAFSSVVICMGLTGIATSHKPSS